MTIPTPEPEAEIPSMEAKPANPDRLPTWEIIALGMGDVVALIVFVIAGRTSHQIEAEGLAGVINTAMPFVTAWLVVSVVLGAFSGKAMYPVLRVIGRTLLAGVVAGPVGVLLRAAMLGRMPAPIFFGVATGLTTLTLVAWRVLWSRVRRLWWPELP